MKPAINDAAAHRRAGGPPPGPSRGRDSENQPRRPDIIEVERQIAELVDRSTRDLRVAWRELHRSGPPEGLSRDLLIRALAHRLQERTDGGTSRPQRRRLQTLAREFEKGSGSSDPGIVLRTGTTLVRQWRGHTHTVLVREDGFEYEGQHYRSLTVIAERITGAHWSGAAVLWPDQASQGFDRRRGQPMTRSSANGTRRSARVRYTANPPRRGSIRNSNRCRHSAKPAKRSSAAKQQRGSAAR
jgi:hypothetical protein